MSKLISKVLLSVLELTLRDSGKPYLANIKIVFLGNNYNCYESVLTQGTAFTANSGTKVPFLAKGRSSTAISGTKVAVLLGTKSYGSLPLLSALPSEQTLNDL